MRAPDWLTARPVAHRGLHDRARGIIENMPGAAAAAVAANFAIECDIQLSADGEAMVHHDFALDRLTEGSGPLRDKTAAELKQVVFKDTPEKMMSLGDLCALVAGRVPLMIEVKSHFDGDRKLVARMADVLASYDGPAAGMSFDPDQVMALRELIPLTAARHRRRARIYRGRLAGGDAGPAPRHAASAPCLPHPAAFRRLVGGRASGRGTLDRAQHFRLPVADLDGAHGGTARHCRASCRSDDFRRVSSRKPDAPPHLKSQVQCTIFGIGHHARWLIAAMTGSSRRWHHPKSPSKRYPRSARFRLTNGTPAPTRGPARLAQRAGYAGFI